MAAARAREKQKQSATTTITRFSKRVLFSLSRSLAHTLLHTLSSVLFGFLLLTITLIWPLDNRSTQSHTFPPLVFYTYFDDDGCISFLFLHCCYYCPTVHVRVLSYEHQTIACKEGSRCIAHFYDRFSL